MEANFSDSSCICFHARRAARKITKIFNEHLRREGLNASQYCTLRIISETASPHISDIGRIMVMDQSAVSRNIDALSKRGLIQTRFSPDDPRKKIVKLTRDGRESLLKAGHAWKRAQNEVIELMGEDEFLLLGKLLNQVAQNKSLRAGAAISGRTQNVAQS